MRKIIAALETSVDGFIEGPNGELDWAMAEDEETWRDVFEILDSKNMEFVMPCSMGSTRFSKPVVKAGHPRDDFSALHQFMQRSPNPQGLRIAARARPIV
jgi:hypothetical protein